MPFALEYIELVNKLITENNLAPKMIPINTNLLYLISTIYENNIEIMITFCNFYKE